MTVNTIPLPSHDNAQMTLMSNGFPLSSDPSRLGKLQPSYPTASIPELREQYQEQGYLWMKGILNRDEVLDFRRRYFEALRPSGLLAEGTEAVEGIYAGAPGDSSLVDRAIMEIVRWARYEAFCLAKPIFEFYTRFFEGEPYLHKRKIIRHTIPGEEHCTGAHYDLVYLRGGTDRICTSWIPIGDTPVQMGGLVYLENSHRYFREQEVEFAAQNSHLKPAERVVAYNNSIYVGWLTRNLAELADQVNTRWLMADYEAGDMMIHDPYTAHASTMNVDPDNRLRLSTDIRYQRVRDEIDIRWSNHWSYDDML